MNIGEFLNTLASLSGVSTDNEALIQIQAASALKEIEMPEELANNIKGGLLTVEAAKSNPELQKHFRSTVLNGLDARVRDLMGVHSSIFTPEAVTRIDSIQSSYDKVNELIKTINSHHESNKPQPKGDEAKHLKEQVEALNSEIRTLKQSAQDREKEFTNQLTAKDTSYAAETLIGSFDFNNNLSRHDYINLTRQKVDAELESQGLVPVLSNGEVIVMRKGEGGTLEDHYVNNEKVYYKDLALKKAADNKYLGVSTPNQPAQPAPVLPQNNGGVNNSKYAQAASEAAKNLAGTQS